MKGIARPERRPRLALPFTMLRGSDRLRLVAGEDCRYELTGSAVEEWAPEFLSRLRGRQALSELLADLDERWRGPAEELVDRLYGERVLVDGTADEGHRGATHAVAVEGSGELRRRLEARGPSMAGSSGKVLRILCQDRLDYEQALRFNRECLETADAWLWATSGPMSRGFVSPVLLPHAGPCLGCLLRHFERLSPAPEVYDELIDHARHDGVIEPAVFPQEGTAMMEALVVWKIVHLADALPPPAVHRLHVLELASMEVSVHRVLLDPECAECAVRR